jgi:hypothetical protein
MQSLMPIWLLAPVLTQGLEVVGIVLKRLSLMMLISLQEVGIRG